jgi:hypothetical protein
MVSTQQQGYVPGASVARVADQKLEDSRLRRFLYKRNDRWLCGICTNRCKAIEYGPADANFTWLQQHFIHRHFSYVGEPVAERDARLERMAGGSPGMRHIEMLQNPTRTWESEDQREEFEAWQVALLQRKT